MRVLLAETIHKEYEMQRVAVRIAEQLPKGSILLLEGPMAAGKTSFVRYFCSFFGVVSVQSPTYAIHQRYRGRNAEIDHFDLYRLETEEQLESAGIHDLLAQPADYKLVEWPERFGTANFQSENLFRLSIEINPDLTRTLTFAILD